MKDFKMLPMIWDEFLNQLCVKCELNREQPETFLVRFADEYAKKEEAEIAAILKISVETYKKRIGGVYKKLAKRYPQIKNRHHKFEPLHSLLKKEYEQLVEQNAEAAGAIAPLDWRKICREMLDAQKQNLRRQVTQMGFELNVYVPIGLFERKQQPRRSNNDSHSPEQGSVFFQPTQEEIIKKYQHDDFLKEVIQQRQSKSEGKQIAIIGEPRAGKTTLPLLSEKEEERFEELESILDRTLTERAIIIEDLLNRLEINPEAIINQLIQYMIKDTGNEIISKTFKKISQDNHLNLIVKSLKRYININFNESEYLDYFYDVIWHCATNMNYPDFYKAWNS